MITIFRAGLILLSLILSCGFNQRELTIISGSENKNLEPLIHRFESANGIKINMIYKGSIDIMRDLETGTTTADAVWPASSMWISLGDKNRRVKQSKSIMMSPVVFGIRKDLAGQLGFIGKDVKVSDILEAIRQKKLHFLMSSATQSNSGAVAYIGFLNALLGNPDHLTKEMLRDSTLKSNMKELFSGINRSSGSSGWLKELFLSGNYDAMVNYESLIIETNQELVRQGKEPLYVVYPVDGIVFSDSPLGFIDNGDKQKQLDFQKFSSFLLSSEIQDSIHASGRRTGISGVAGKDIPEVFNAQWGIDLKKILSPVPMPSPEVLFDALDMYQSQLRKPSYTVFCLDYSGSMEGDGVSQLREAMNMLLDKDEAKKFLLNMSENDKVMIIAFSDHIKARWEVDGKDTVSILKALEEIRNLSPGGNTDIYSPIVEGMNVLSTIDFDKYIPAVLLMTDGESNTGGSLANIQNTLTESGKDIPVFSIMFGDASEKQLQPLAAISHGLVFDGRKDLAKAFRTAKGYN